MIHLFKIASPAGRMANSYLTGLLLIIVTAITSAATIRIANADFKGEWTYNEQKSKVGEGRFRMNAQKIKVTQEGDALVIERTSASPNGETLTNSEKLTFDGKASESTISGTVKKKSVPSWSQDGQQLTINSTVVFDRDGNQVEIKVVEIWKLTDGGKSLSIDYTSTSPRGTNNNTFVYDKTN